MRLRQVGSTTDGRPIRAAVYPRPDYPGTLWTQWGQGVLLPDGRLLSALGDHGLIDANSFLFVYDPTTGTLTRFADVNSVVGHRAGEIGYGKVHAQMVRVGCQVVLGTFWGTRKGLAYGSGYTGDHLLAVSSELAVRDLGVPVPEHGVPSLAGFGDLIYGEATDPRGRAGQSADVGAFFVFDLSTGKVTFRSDDQSHTGFRAMAVTGSGQALVARGDRGLLSYTPGGVLQPSPSQLSAGWLRAATQPAPDGTVYLVTRQPERYLAVRASGRIDDLGPASGYITSAALASSGNEFYVVPDAHGLAWRRQAPLLAVDVHTGAERVVANLGPMVEQHLGLVLGGSYNVVVSADGTRVMVGFNAGATTDNPWGEVVLVEVPV